MEASGQKSKDRMKLKIRSSGFLVLSFAAMTLLAIEASSYKPRLPADPIHNRNFIMNRLPAPLSLLAFQTALLECDDNLSLQGAAFRTFRDIQGSAKSCGKTANRTIKLMPTHGLGYLVAARVAALQGDVDRVETLVQLSKQHTRFEGWLAIRRFVFLSNAGNAPHGLENLEIETLLTMQSGAELISEYYMRRPNTRHEIAKIASNADHSDVQRFLNLLQKQSATK